MEQSLEKIMAERQEPLGHKNLENINREKSQSK